MKTFILTLLLCLLSLICFAEIQIIDTDDKPAYKENIGEDNDEIIIGEDNKPQVKLSRWNKEEFLTIRYGKDIFSNFVLADNKVTATSEKENIEFYKDGESFKFIIILKEKPSSNVLTYYLEGWEDFNFWFQPPLKNLNPDGSTWEETYDNEKLVMRDERPAEIVGSYAVYHKTKKNHIIGQTNYKTGKFCHIFRPKFIDDDGKSVWADLHIENGIYTVTIPQSFLDTAKYPVKSNDTFGYLITTGTSSVFNPDFIYALLKASPALDGTATSVSMYNAGGSGRPITLGIYSDDSDYPDVLLRDTSEGTTLAGDWITIALDSNLDVTSGTDYWLAQNHDNEAITFKYDATAGFSARAHYKAQAYSSGSLVAPFPAGATNAGNRDHAIYVTYTPGVAVRRVIFISKADEK